MNLSRHQDDFDYCLQRAGELLGVPCRGLSLDYWMDWHLRRAVVFEQRCGIGHGLAVEQFRSGDRGHATVWGMERFRCAIDGRTFHVVRVINGLFGDETHSLHGLWVVPCAEYVTLFRYLRRKARVQQEPDEQAPIMRAEDKARLWENTVGFLQHGSDVLERYGVVRKRGVLLTGEPGNGKTMASRWLASECQRADLAWRHVTIEEYLSARSHGSAAELFDIGSPGIVLFDDFDLGMRNRDEHGANPDHSLLLGELDGVMPRSGVVFLFTTNAQVRQLDPAFLRRGRIDRVIHFPRPDGELRRRLIAETWHVDIRESVDTEAIVTATEGMSFAEVAELKKLLVVRFLEAQAWDWHWAWQAYLENADQQQPASRIGFGVLTRPNSQHLADNVVCIE